jgi:hypothetical protein
VPEEALDAAPDSPARSEKAKNAGPDPSVGRLGTRVTMAGNRWGGPWLRARRGAFRSPAPRKPRKGTPRGSGDHASPASPFEDQLEEQVLALPVVGRPQQRRFLEIQITGCRRTYGVLLSRGGLYSLPCGGTQQSVKEVMVDTFILSFNTYYVLVCI